MAPKKRATKSQVEASRDLIVSAVRQAAADRDEAIAALSRAKAEADAVFEATRDTDLHRLERWRESRHTAYCLAHGALNHLIDRLVAIVGEDEVW